MSLIDIISEANMNEAWIKITTTSKKLQTIDLKLAIVYYLINPLNHRQRQQMCTIQEPFGHRHISHWNDQYKLSHEPIFNECVDHVLFHWIKLIKFKLGYSIVIFMQLFNLLYDLFWIFIIFFSYVSIK